jgi:hypothetical protein
MKRTVLLAALALIAGPVAADSAAGFAAIQDLGRVNGQALACSQMAISSQSKQLMIRHAPKTRLYGEAFEETTNAAFLRQGQGPDNCPQPVEFVARISELAGRLQATLPVAP